MYLGSTRLRAAGGRGCFAKMRQGNMPWSAFCGRSSCRILSTSPVIPGGAKDLAVLSAGYAPCHLEQSERSIPSATPMQSGNKNLPFRARFGFFLNPGTKSALFVPTLDQIISLALGRRSEYASEYHLRGIVCAFPLSAGYAFAPRSYIFARLPALQII